MSSAPAPGTRRAVEGAQLSAGVVLVAALVLMVNYLGARHYQRFDWTSSDLYTLTEKSRNVVRGLDKDVEAVIFMNPGSEIFGPVDELLSRYEAANPERFKKRVVDPARNLLEAQRLVEQHGIDRENVVVLAAGDDRRVIDEYDIAEYDYSGMQMGQPPTLKELKGEKVITGALLALVEAEKPRVLYVTGHGEAALDGGMGGRSFSAARDLLGQDNFETAEWSSAEAADVPADTDLLILAGPTTRFLGHELEAFSRYLESGGRMLVLLDPAFGPDGAFVDLGLGPWLSRYGLELHDDIVIDPAGQLPFFGPESLFVADFGSHPTVDALAQTSGRAILTLARSLGVDPDALPDGVEAEELLRSSDEAWGETDLAALDRVGQDDGDHAGPLALAAAVSFPVGTDFGPLGFGSAVDGDGADGGVRIALSGAREDAGGADGDAAGPLDGPADDPLADPVDPATEQDAADVEDADEARLVVFGDADFALGGQLGNMSNGILLLNTMNWLVKREELIDIEGRTPEQTKLTLTRSELSSIYWLVLGILPGLAVVFGVSTHLRRRR